MSGLLTLNDFQRHFPLMTPLSRANDICWLDSPDNTVRNEQMCTGDANTQAAAVALYQVGCFLGAVLILFYGEVWGRKSSTFWGSLIMIIGTIFQVAAGGTSGGDAGAYAVLVVGRIVGGVGNGMVTSSKSCVILKRYTELLTSVAIPTWQSECAKPEQRGRLIITSGAIITAGIMISYWVGYGFYFLPANVGYSSVRWRFPIAFQSFFTVIVMYVTQPRRPVPGIDHLIGGCCFICPTAPAGWSCAAAKQKQKNFSPVLPTRISTRKLWALNFPT